MGTKYCVSGIDYDTDETVDDLPTEMSIEVPFDVDDVESYIDNHISNETGFCVTGYIMDKE